MDDDYAEEFAELARKQTVWVPSLSILVIRAWTFVELDAYLQEARQ